MSIEEVAARQGPRKLLALDGGGIRGILSIEVLARIEQLLQTALKRDDSFVLADYFDYVAGTSTGAIIATCVSLGMRVDAIRNFYLASGPDMFNKTKLLERFRQKFKDAPLAVQLKQVLGATTTLGSRNLKTYLMLVLRNATTDSPWPVSNNPDAIFNLPGVPGCNLDLPLWQLVRASSAAPTYFPPEVIRLDDDAEFIFVDGGVTMYNNPAFQLFLMATIEPYNLCWKTGVGDMLLVSVGTGTSPGANADLTPNQMNLLYNASSIPSALMFAASNEQDLLCRVFGDCLEGAPLDLEVSDMIGKRGPTAEKLFTYVRYNAELSREGLNALGLHDVVPDHVQRLDSTDHIGDLQRVGREVAKRVKPEHFARFV